MKRDLGQASLFTLLLWLDQYSKAWVESAAFQPMVVFEGWFNLVRAHNPGVAFSLFENLPDAWRVLFLLTMTISIAAVVVIWWWRTRTQKNLVSWLLVLVLVGAVGNIWDRLQYGYVVDFIQWYVLIDTQAYVWPAFNVADSCISVALVGLLLHEFFGKSGAQQHEA